jgi:hypothetical protein
VLGVVDLEWPYYPSGWGHEQVRGPAAPHLGSQVSSKLKVQNSESGSSRRMGQTAMGLPACSVDRGAVFDDGLVLGGKPMPVMPYSAVEDVVASFSHFGC